MTEKLKAQVAEEIARALFQHHFNGKAWAQLRQDIRDNFMASAYPIAARILALPNILVKTEDQSLPKTPGTPDRESPHSKLEKDG